MSEQRLPIGTVLEGRFRLVSEGTGHDLGTVYKAYDMQRDRLVAVLALSSHYGSGVAAWERLTKSQEAIANLAQPGLIPYEHVGLFNGQPYLVRRQVEGQTLAHLLAQTGRLQIEPAIQIAIRLCEVLASVHRAGLVHGGLSPHSVVVGGQGEITVTDAGLLPALRPLYASPGQPWGRFPHLSPEQAAGEDAHAAADVYVIGALLYEMLTGRPPLRAHDRAVLVLQHIRQEPPSLQVLVPQAPLPLVQIVHKALAKEPANRYRNASQLAHILRSQFGSRPAPRPEAAAPQQAPAREHLVVPAPPVESRPEAIPPARVTYITDAEAGGWDEDTAGVDWLMIGLIVAALIAVLGLIPLWRTVYRRYAVPPSIPTPVSYHVSQEDLLSDPSCSEQPWNWAQTSSELGDPALVWYNQCGSRCGVDMVGHGPRALVSWPFVESSLRVFGLGCYKLGWR